MCVLGHTQRFRTIEKQIQQQQHPEKAEIGVADQREPERSVAAHRAHLPPDFGGEIGVELSSRVRRRNFRDAEAREKSNHRQRDEDDAGKPLAPAKLFGHRRRGDGAQNDGHEGAEFEDAVAPGKFFLRQQLRQRAVFGRAENRAVRAHEKNAGEQQIFVPRPKSGEHERHDEQLKNFHAEHHASVC